MSETYDASMIKVLKGLEAVRRRPVLYISDLDKAPNRIIKILFEHLLDYYIYHPEANHIQVKIDNEKASLWINKAVFKLEAKQFDDEYFTACEIFFTHLSFGGKSPQSIMNSPLSVANALCRYLYIKYSDGHTMREHWFSKGEVVRPTEQSITNNSSPYTQIDVELDSELLEFNKPNVAQLQQYFFEVAHFYPNLTIEFNNERYCEPRGLLAMVDYLGVPDTNHIYYLNQFFPTNNKMLQIALVGKTTQSTRWYTWINNERVQKGSHIAAVRRVLQKLHWKPELVLFHLATPAPTYSDWKHTFLKDAEIYSFLKNLLSQELVHKARDTYGC